MRKKSFCSYVRLLHEFMHVCYPCHSQHLLFLFDLSAKQLLWLCRSCNSCLARAVRAKGSLAVWCCVTPTSAVMASSPVWAARDWHSLAMANQGFLHTAPMGCSSFPTLFKNGTGMHTEGCTCRNAINKRISMSPSEPWQNVSWQPVLFSYDKRYEKQTHI